MPEVSHRSGVVALLGRPNAGKSTLLNRLVGEKLAIVTPKPQTTRSRILGIVNLPGGQLLLVDTPGRHQSAKAFNVALNELVDEAAEDCDVALLLVDPREPWGDDQTELLAGLRARQTPVLLVATKQDLPQARAAAWPPPEAPAADASLRVSAQTGEGVDGLLGELLARVPEGPALYPDDQLSDRPLRFLAAELVREAATLELAQELPYVCAVEVVEFDEKRDDLVRIRANLLVQRQSQKQIAVGRGGSVVKRIGSRARLEIERLVGRKVFLELRVKVEPNWMQRPNRLKSLGYR